MANRVQVWVLLVGVVGCGDSVAGASAGATGGSSTSGPATTSGGSTGDTSTSDVSTVSTGPSSEGSSGSSSTSGGLLGPGCGEPPPCRDTVLEGSVRIESSADLASIEGVSRVTGFVEIIGSDLECLDALSCLEDVGRDLRVQGNDDLRSTSGLANVASVGTSSPSGGDVVVADNPALVSLEGLASQRIDGVVAVWRNASLQEIPGFADLRRLTILSVQDNPVLDSLGGLRELNRLERCDVNHNPSLCLSEVFAVCGDVLVPPEGVTDFNDDAC